MVKLLYLASLAAFATAEAVIGVAPEDQHLYKARSDGTWSCLSDPSIVISESQINDDICDCPDGSDEPGTAACSNSAGKGFYCANEGYFPAYIQNFKVNDGVCDYEICCDGSDEWATGKCPNKCQIVREKFDNYVAERKADIEKALRVRQQYIKKAEEAKAEVVKELETLNDEIKSLSEKLVIENKHLKEAQSLASHSGSQEGASNEISQQISKLQEYFESSIASKKKSQDVIKKLEDLLADLAQNYNPNYNDATVKNCVRSFREYVTQREDDGEDDESSMETIKSLLKSFSPPKLSTTEEFVTVPTFGNMVHYYFTKLVNTFGKNPETKVVEPQGSQAKTKEEAEIELAIKKLEKEIHSKKSEASIYEDSIQQQFGKDDIFRALQGEWVSRKIGEYNYKIGYLDAIYQDNTLIGHLSSVTGSTLHFTQGAKCWNGPHRSATVDMVCASESRVVSVSEPEKCHYRFLLETPVVCEKVSDEEIAKGFKVEPSEL